MIRHIPTWLVWLALVATLLFGGGCEAQAPLTPWFDWANGCDDPESTAPLNYDLTEDEFLDEIAPRRICWELFFRELYREHHRRTSESANAAPKWIPYGFDAEDFPNPASSQWPGPAGPWHCLQDAGSLKCCLGDGCETTDSPYRFSAQW